MKIRKYLFWILMFLLLSSPKKVHANQLATLSNLPPTLSQSSFNTISSFASMVPDIYLNSQGIAPIQDNFIETYNNATSNSLSFNYQFNYKPFTEIDWTPAFPLWDSNGNEVSLSNAGLCTGSGASGSVYFIYDTTTGEILNLGETSSTSITTLNYYADPIFKANLLTITSNFGSNTSAHPLAIFDETTSTAQQIATYESLPYSSYTYWDSGNYYFCPNGNLPGTLISVNTSGSQQQFYANEDGKDLITYQWEYGNRHFWVQGSYTIGGYTYQYKAFGGTSFGVNTNKCKMYNYNANDTVANKASYYNPCNTEDLPDVVNADKILNHSFTKSDSFNSSYNGNNDPSTLNAPILSNVNYGGGDYDPDYNWVEDYEDSTLPQPTPMPNPSINPSIGDDVGDIDPNDIGTNVPILEGLINRFPFSIPWDIYSILHGLEAERETPYIDTTIIIPAVNYEWHIEYDLSDFDGIALLFRRLFLIAFILGLAYFSYDHFFGE